MKIRLLGILLLLCGFAGAQTQTFCSSSSNCNLTGNNTHSGTEGFTGKVNVNRIGGLLYTDPDQDGPGTTLNLNECQAIDRQHQIARSLGWNALNLVSNWHGHKQCGTSDPNANYPSAIGANPPTFAEVLDMQPDNLIVSDQHVVARANQHWDFHNPDSSLASASTGVQAGFAASTAFVFTGTNAVFEMGAPTGTSLPTGGQPQGVQLVNAGVYGFEPGVGAWKANSICILNQYAQEFSFVANLEIDGCQIGFDKQDSGTGFGSINDGPHRLLKINMTGCNTTACRAIRIGKGNAENNDVSNARGFEHISANTSGALVEPAIAIELNGAGIPLYDIHLEQWTEGIALGDLGFAKNNTLTQIECDGTIAKPFMTCVHIYNTNEFGNTYGNTLTTVSSTGNLTNLLVDERSGGGTVTWATSGTLALYAHALGGNVISSSPEIPSRMTFATGTALSALSSPTADVAFAMSGHGVTYNASSAQAASMANFQGSSGNTDTHPFINATTANAAEVGYTFSQVGKSKLAPDSNGNVFLQNLQTATLGANINCTTFIQQGRYYTGSASTGENVTPQCVYGSGANPTMTYSFALTNPGTGEHRFDLSNWAKVLSKNISTGTASNTDLAGAVTLVAGTGTYTFAQAYTSAPICVATDTTAAAAVRASTTTTVLTLTGTGTDVISYHCVGRN